MHRSPEQLYLTLVTGIKNFFEAAGARTAVLGLSGGIDSAIVLCLAVDALGKESVRALMMPSPFSTVHSVTDAVKIAEQVNISYDIIPIDSIYYKYIKELAPLLGNDPPDLTEENLQARIRGTILMAHSNKKGSLLLNTTNKSELAMGYGTLYGDLSGALMVLADVYKTQLYDLAAYLNTAAPRIPLSIIKKEPSAELRIDQKDSDTLPPYPLLDPVLYALIEEQQSPQNVIDQGASKEVVEQVMKAKHTYTYKHLQLPPLIKVTDHPLLPPDKWR
ncbi:MAG: NAD(+) synthase [Prevotellaceae bacterium]|jgi:NAD+ synthase (glutamine-hydrolysing)|nr:NAD(+) synthase [Prevotellaceae bacterium]